MKLVRYSHPSYRSLAPSAGGFARSPWSSLESEIDRLYGSALADLDFGVDTANRFPIDLYEDKDSIHVRAELPGVSREDIGVEMVDGYLNVAAVRKTPRTDGDGEESYSFSRSVSLNTDVDADKVKAVYEDGVLAVTLPKREEAKPKKITVAVK
jgi:HSP20 family protein